jgi:protein-S-isoprenylcysteine O-methyltransferase Ste14
MVLRVVSVLGFLLMVTGIALLIRLQALVGEFPVPVAIQILSVALMVWARITFGRRSFHAAANPTVGGVVTSGPYAFLRHPIYAAVLWFVWAGILTHPSPGGLASGLLIVAGAVMRIVPEERLLTERYPEYAAYAARTKRIIPFLM